MKVITCASYYGSGSSAVTNLVSEYDNVKGLSDFEIRFAHQLDGVSDLEFHLVENHDRINSGHALKRFQKLLYFYEGHRFSKLYSQFIDKAEFRKVTDEYIQNLLDFSYAGWEFYDLYDKGKYKYYFLQFFNHLFQKTRLDLFRILPKEHLYCSHPTQDAFLMQTRKYTHEILELLNSSKSEYLVVDQLFPSANIERITRYFEDEIFTFVVDRDPRDVYLLGKYCWNDVICPKDPALFCKWFSYARRSGNSVPEDNTHTIKIMFEDLIYRYDDTVKKIEIVTGLSSEHHIQKFEKMNPKRSVVNTRIWEKYPDDEGIKVIEKELKEYLYDYSSFNHVIIPGKETSSNNSF